MAHKDYSGLTPGETDFDQDQVVLGRDPETGAAYVLPNTVRRMPEDARASVMAVLRTGSEVQQLLERLDELVDQAREHGASWSVIGWAVGMSGEGARLRWGLDVE
jgi:hypothetical protein